MIHNIQLNVIKVIVTFSGLLLLANNTIASDCNRDSGDLKLPCYTLARNEAALGSPSAMISTFKRSRSPVEQIAKGLKNTFSLNAQQVAKLLAEENYSSVETAKAMKLAYQGSNSQISAWLKNAGYSGKEIAKALKQSLSVSAEINAHLCKKIFKASVSQVSQWLKSAGYSALQVAPALSRVEKDEQKMMQALKSSFNLTAKQLVGILKKTKKIMTLQRCKPEQCDGPARLLKNINYPLKDVIVALKQHFHLTASAAYTIANSIYRANHQEIKQVLGSSGYTSNEILKNITHQ
ncbi:MAG: hypothetical protein ACRBCS_09940 [Cellvibrionaceae bacterium]